MPTDSVFLWIATGIIFVIIVGNLLAAQSKRVQRKQVFTFWQRVGLPMATDEINASVSRRLHRSATASMFGALAGALVASCILFLTPEPDFSFSYSWLVVLPAVLIGMNVFDVALALRDSLFTKRPDAPRLARAMSISPADYLSPWRVRMAPLLIILAGLVFAAALALGAMEAISLSAFWGSMALSSLAVAVLALLGAVLVSRRIVQTPQPVSDPLELAWADAIRADTFRKLHLLTASVAWLALGAGALGVTEAMDPSLAVSAGLNLGQLLISWRFLAILLMFTYGSSHSYFRYRLWPKILMDTEATTSGER